MKYPNPPRWAETLLRASLKPRDRDTVSGDLVEEYREDILPERGPFGARLWYLRQVASLLDLPALGRIASPFQWTAVVALTQFVFLVLVPRAFGLMLELSLFVPVAVALGIMGAISIRSREEIGLLARLSVLSALLFSALMLSKMFLDALSFRALGIALLLVFLFPAGCAAWRTGQVRAGILAVMGTSLFGSLLVTGTVEALLRFGIVGRHPPVGLNFVLLAMAVSVIVGTMGAMFAKAFRTLIHRPLFD